MSRRCAVVIALWLGTGCGTPGKPASSGPAAPASDAGPPDALSLDRDYAKLAERAVALYAAVAEAFRAAGQDCAQATARLGELAGTYRDVVAANAKVLHEGRARELKQALGKHGDRFDTAAKAIIESPTMARCSEDPSFTKAFDDLVGAPP
jgi:hypothetical protein